MRVNISRIQARLMCPAYEHYRYRLERAPQFAGVALYTGIAVHKFFEVFLLHGGTRENALAGMEEEFVKAFALCEPGDKNYEKLDFDLRLMRKIMPHYQKPADWTVLATEKMLEVQTPVNRHTIFGRLDALVDWNGRLWHLQHKTASVYTAMDVYVRGIQRSWHENVYGAMIQREFPDRRYGGTMLNVVKKIQIGIADKSPASAFKTEFIPITNKAIKQVMGDLDQIIDTMHFEHLDAVARQAPTKHGEELVPAFSPVQHRDACTGKFGNSLCAYIDVCEGTDTILSDRFQHVNPLAAYGLQEGGGE